ncbi:MAG: hypothetical protein ACOVSW_14800 [Candidatus Kapaibacteriota bacterium]
MTISHKRQQVPIVALGRQRSCNPQLPAGNVFYHSNGNNSDFCQTSAFSLFP